jgi:hypothetical protein
MSTIGVLKQSSTQSVMKASNVLCDSLDREPTHGDVSTEGEQDAERRHHSIERRV